MTRTSLFMCLALLASPNLVRADDVRGLIDLLKRGDTPELQRRVTRDPIAVLAQLADAVPVAIDELGAEARVVTCVVDAVATAMTTATDPRAYVHACEGPTTPEVVLAVVRGATRLLERPPGGDQGVPDWPGFLEPLVTFADSPAVRVAACEALGKLPPTKSTARALIRALADEEPAVKAAAAQVLERLSKQSDRGGFERWAATLPGLAISPELLRSLVTDEVREELPWLRQRLVTAPRESLQELAQALQDLPGFLESQAAFEGDAAAEVATLQARVDERVTTLVAEAVRTSEDVRPHLDVAPDGPVPVAAGVARGIGRRAAPFAGRANPLEWKQRLVEEGSLEAEAESEAPPAPTEQARELPDADELMATLSVLAERPEPEVALEAYRAAGAALPQLDPLWLELLTRPLERPEHGVAERAARLALKAISGQDLPPSAPHWRRWWAGDLQGAPGGPSGN